MTLDRDSQTSQLETLWLKEAAEIRALAAEYSSDRLAILHLLRGLEELHREIRDGLFQSSLPESRHELYALLRDIEEQGGWPYIEKMSLRNLLAALPEDFWIKESSFVGEVEETER